MIYNTKSRAVWLPVAISLAALAVLVTGIGWTEIISSVTGPFGHTITDGASGYTITGTTSGTFSGSFVGSATNADSLDHVKADFPVNLLAESLAVKAPLANPIFTGRCSLQVAIMDTVRWANGIVVWDSAGLRLKSSKPLRADSAIISVLKLAGYNFTVTGNYLQGAANTVYGLDANTAGAGMIKNSLGGMMYSGDNGVTYKYFKASKDSATANWRSYVDTIYIHKAVTFPGILGKIIAIDTTANDSIAITTASGARWAIKAAVTRP